MRYAANPLSRGKVLYFIFLNGDNEPSYVIKLPRFKLGEKLLKEESKIIEEIRKAYPTLKNICFPKLCTDEFGSFFLEKYIKGKRFNINFHSQFLHDKAIDWLLYFQKHTRQDKLSKDIFCKKAREIINKYIHFCKPGNWFEGFEERFLIELDKISDFTMDLVCQHGDFTKTNLIYNGKGIFITDWEYTQASGESYFDILTFSINNSLKIEENGENVSAQVKSFYTSFVKGNWYTKILKHSIDRYIKTSGTKSEILQICLPLTLMTLSYREIEKSGERGDGFFLYSQILKCYLENEDNIIIYTHAN